MSEIYPLRAPGEWAGTKCTVEICPKYARFVVLPYGQWDKRLGSCKVHVAPVMRGVQLRTNLPVVVQEVPGMWQSETVVQDGKQVLIPMKEHLRP